MQKISYERFTDRARKAMQFANMEAQLHNVKEIQPLHIFIGICREGSGMACKVLSGMVGVESGSLLKSIRALLEEGPDFITMGKLSLSDLSNVALRSALGWAGELKHHYVGTEHLLLGVCQVESVALGSLGITKDKVLAGIKDVLKVFAPGDPMLTAMQTYVAGLTDGQLAKLGLMRIPTAPSSTSPNSEAVDKDLPRGGFF